MTDDELQTLTWALDMYERDWSAASEKGTVEIDGRKLSALDHKTEMLGRIADARRALTSERVRRGELGTGALLAVPTSAPAHSRPEGR